MDSLTTAMSMDDSDLPPDDAIAIVGMACNYPGGQNPDLFWDTIRNGRSAVGEVPPDRWSADFYSADRDQTGKTTSRWGGFLPSPFPSGFDAAFFDIPPIEAQALDPQQRLLLEVGWRALEDSGIVTDPDNGRPIGVFVAISTTDYHGAKLWQPGLTAIDPFTATGASFAAAAGRLSYSFGFNGPCLAIDTACSSSLVAFHTACQSLRLGECEAALVAGVNALLTPNLFVCLSKMGLMSRDGLCKTFDADGNGYVRAEGCGALVLRKYGQAVRNGERILAVCLGSAVNQDGRSNGLTAPSGVAQERVIGQALARAGLEFGDVDYVEAHGTGTPLGDAVELNALAGTYAQGRDRSAPLLVGSVKTNIGHLEAGAGIAGLIKTVQCLRHGEIPPHLNLRRRTPHLDWDNTALTVPMELTSWPVTGRPRRAGVSSFGFSGTNAHVILQAAPADRPTSGARSEIVVLPISARNVAALDEYAATLADWLTSAPRNLADVGYTLAVRRKEFAHRRAVVGATAAELASALRGGATAPKQDDRLRSRLTELSRLWTNGTSVDWARLYGSSGARVISMPGHPFQRQPHWSDPVAPPTVAGPTDRRTEPRMRPVGVAAWRRVIDEEARRLLSDQKLPPLDPHRPLREQGLTSLMGVELRRVLESFLDRSVSATVFYNYPSIDLMAAFLASPEADGNSSGQAERPQATGGWMEEDFGLLDAMSTQDLVDVIEREVKLE
jgi:acyl transferase domain-containing protein